MPRTSYAEIARTIPTGVLAAELQRRQEPIGYTTVVLPSLKVMPAAKLAIWGGERVALSSRETDVLTLLASTHPVPVTSEVAGERIWDGGQAGPESFRFYVCALRKKMPGLIKSERLGGGYYLDLPVAEVKAS